MSLPSTSQAVSQPIETAPSASPSAADWALLAFFIPFAAWVVWTSWRWRLERLGIRSLDS